MIKKLVNVEYLRKQRDKEAKIGKISSSCSGKEIPDQQIEKRRKMKCKTCGGSGTVWSRGPISGCCGSAVSEGLMCPECHGWTNSSYVLWKHPSGFLSGWIDYNIRLW